MCSRTTDASRDDTCQCSRDRTSPRDLQSLGSGGPRCGREMLWIALWRMIRSGTRGDAMGSCKDETIILPLLLQLFECRHSTPHAARFREHGARVDPSAATSLPHYSEERSVVGSLTHTSEAFKGEFAVLCRVHCAHQPPTREPDNESLLDSLLGRAPCPLSLVGRARSSKIRTTETRSRVSPVAPSSPSSCSRPLLAAPPRFPPFPEPLLLDPRTQVEGHEPGSIQTFHRKSTARMRLLT